MTAALAASVIGLIALGAGGYAWTLRQRAERAGRVAAAVDVALAEAARLAGEARAAPEGAAARWAEAIAQARRSEDLVKQGDADDPTRRRVAEADRRLLDRLADIRGGKHDDLAGVVNPQTKVCLAYAEAFRSAGLDPDARPTEAGAAIRLRPPAVALGLAMALDHWASLQSDWLGDKAGAARLSAAARAADPDPWRCDLRAALGLSDQARRLAELRGLAGSARPDELGPISLDLLGRALDNAGDPSAAESVLRSAQRRHPDDPWVNLDLAKLLERHGRREEALRFYYAARAARPAEGIDLVFALEQHGQGDEAIAVLRDLARLRPEEYLSFLGSTLRRAGQRAEADTVLEAAVARAREQVRERPDDVGARLYLGDALKFQDKDDEAEAELRAAVRQRPDLASALTSLGSLLLGKNPAEAEALFRRAIRLTPGDTGAHNGLGIALERQGKYREAEVPYLEAIRLDSQSLYHGNLARSLLNQGKHAEAEAAYREATRLDPRTYGFGLALALERQGKLTEAEAVYREAIRVGGRSMQSKASLNLGKMLMSQGRLEDALATLRRVSAPVDSDAWWTPEVANVLRRVERRIALAPRLPAVLNGDARPADAREGLDLAGLCLDSGRPAAAARLFSDAMAADPTIADARGASSRYEHPPREDAARAAALAGCGKGQDDPPPEADERARLRRQALDWLRAELAAWTKEVDAGSYSTRMRALAALTRWQHADPDLGGVRTPEGLAGLPEAEQAAWRALWAEVEALQKRLWTAPR